MDVFSDVLARTDKTLRCDSAIGTARREPSVVTAVCDSATIGHRTTMTANDGQQPTSTRVARKLYYRLPSCLVNRDVRASS